MNFYQGEEEMTCRWRQSGVFILLFLAAVVVPVAAVRAEPPVTQVNGLLTQIDGVRVIKVWGTPHERGFAQGQLVGEEYIRLWGAFIETGALGGGAEGYEQHVLPMLRLFTFGPEFEAEMRGFLAGIEAKAGGPARVDVLNRPLKYEDILATNCVPDFMRMGCSSFAVWGKLTEDGKPLVGRNLDWPEHGPLVGTQIVVVQLPNKKEKRHGWVSITWPGFIGCLTGMNDDGVTVAMHDANGLQLTQMGGFSPLALTYREAIETASGKSAMDDVAKLLRTRIGIAGTNMMVARPAESGSPMATVFEYDGNRENANGLTVREPRKGDTFLLCTNHFCKRREATVCGRFEKIEARLKKLQTGGKSLSVSKAWRLLGGVPIDGILTHHSVVFEPDRRRMQVAFATSEKNAPKNNRIEISLAELLAESGSAD